MHYEQIYMLIYNSIIHFFLYFFHLFSELLFLLSRKTDSEKNCFLNLNQGFFRDFVIF